MYTVCTGSAWSLFSVVNEPEGRTLSDSWCQCFVLILIYEVITFFSTVCMGRVTLLGF